jgi:hypothetical protein
MCHSTDPRPLLSAEDSDSVHHTILLAESLLRPTPRVADSLPSLQELVDRCHEDVRQLNPTPGEYRLDALDLVQSALPGNCRNRMPGPAHEPSLAESGVRFGSIGFYAPTAHGRHTSYDGRRPVRNAFLQAPRNAE